MSELTDERPGFVRAMQWGIGGFIAFTSLPAFRAPGVPIGVGVCLVWLGLFITPLGGMILRQLGIRLGGWVRLGVAVVPPMVGIAILSRLPDGNPALLSLKSENHRLAVADSQGRTPPNGSGLTGGSYYDPPPSLDRQDTSVTQTTHDDAADGGFVRKMVGDKLRDPPSARYSDVMAYRSGDKLAFCGSVNAKNGFGGYTGPEPFIIGNAGFFIGEAASAERVARECQGAVSTPVSVP